MLCLLEWILGSFHNVNEAFRRENGYLTRTRAGGTLARAAGGMFFLALGNFLQ
eukprot:SAG25_NODE_788_length_5307_cov_2.800115_6_plen_53_part_00